MNDQLLLSSTFEKLRHYLNTSQSPTQKPVEFKTPLELKQLMDLPVAERGLDEQGFLTLVEQVLEYSVRTGNKQFLNQLYAGFNLPAFIGELLTALTNTSMYTFEVAPVATLVELEMIRLMNSYTGYIKGDGIFLSGGSNANLVAMFSARNQLLPDSRFTGYDRTKKLTAFTNEHSHYSIETAANILGIGSQNIIKVKTDRCGKMIPVELEKELAASRKRGEQPFFVAATCATTMLAAYDPLRDLAEICNTHDLWLHADGSYGGSLLLSDTHRHLLDGIERTDSFAWNPHKLMNIPLTCSALLLRERGVLQHNLTDINTDYIFHDSDAIEDLGKKSIQCGRRVDAVKLWFAWKYYGLEGYRQRMDKLIDLAAYAESIVVKEADMELMAERQSFAVCFRYAPSNGEEPNTFNLRLRETLRKNGKTMVNYGYLGKTLVIRLVIANGELEKADLDLFFSRLLECARELNCPG